ncbi:MAG: glyoxylate/hydroxypyruvate reductase A, partial [Bacteroidales bacterium]|nr:glyoxylate/hydroxypyruvate reductase A [Bacteroidales bacterium]
MSLLILSPTRETDSWVQAIKLVDSSIDVFVYPESIDNKSVEFVLAWNHPYGSLKNYPNLKCISSMGAGVDYLFKDPELPENVLLTRIVDPELSKTMFEFILALVMNHLRSLTQLKKIQSTQEWKPQPYKRIEDVRIGIMGLGEIGSYVAERLIELGFAVNGWAQSPKLNSRAKVYIGTEGLGAFMQNTDILVCLLPSTPETSGLLNKKMLQYLPKGASLINVARGDILVDNDLIDLLDSAQLSMASLDVFTQEPLPSSHLFWKHKKIDITPHVASLTNPKTVAPQIIENYWRMKKGEQLLHKVSP